jgi:hypothetical protein
LPKISNHSQHKLNQHKINQNELNQQNNELKVYKQFNVELEKILNNEKNSFIFSNLKKYKSLTLICGKYIHLNYKYFKN